jgi:hypothetical protein
MGMVDWWELRVGFPESPSDLSETVWLESSSHVKTGDQWYQGNEWHLQRL